MQLHKHISIFAYMQYANICAYHMQISAHAICKYLQMQYSNMHITLLTGMQLKSTDPTSSLWARVPQLKGFVKLLFSNTPGAFGYKKTGHGAWLTEVSLNFSRHFFGFPEMCAIAACSGLIYLILYIYDCWVNLGKRHKIW